MSPLQDRLDEWKKTTMLLDKDHSKEIKRLRQELKKRHAYDVSHSKGKKLSGSSFASGSTLSGIFSKSMECMEGNDKLLLLEEMERKSLRRVLIEERSRFCLFVNFLRPVVEEEIAMLNEVNHLQEIMDHLSKLTVDPYILPPSSEMVIADLKFNSSTASTRDNNHYQSNTHSMTGNDVSGSNSRGPTSSASTLSFKSQSQLNLRSSPPSSPVSSFSASLSRKSSMCSLSSFNDGSSDGRNSVDSHSPAPPAGVRRHGTHGHHHRKNHSISMFDSRNIESLITYHPSTSSSSQQQQQQQHHSRLQHQQSNPTGMTSSKYSVGTPVDIPSLPPGSSLRRASGMASSTIEIPSQSLYASTGSEYASVNSNIMSQSCRDSIIYSSSGNIPLAAGLGTLSRSGSRSNSSSGRPPPPPPARRTSSISDPNAITLGTLATTGCSTYEEVRTLRRTGDSSGNIYASFQGMTCDPYKRQEQHQAIYSNFTPSNVAAPSTGVITTGPLIPERTSSCSGGRSGSSHTNHTSSSTSTPTASGGGVISSSTTTQSGNNSRSSSHSSTAVSSPAKTPVQSNVNSDYVEASGMIGSAISTLKAVYAQTIGSSGNTPLTQSQQNSFDSPSDTAPLLPSMITSPASMSSGNHVSKDSGTTSYENSGRPPLNRDDSLPPPPPEAFLPPVLPDSCCFDASSINSMMPPACESTSGKLSGDCASSTSSGVSSNSSGSTTSTIKAGSVSEDSKTTGQRTYNRLASVHRDFLQTLNETLSQNRDTRLSPRLTKRRSMSVGDHDWDSDRDSGIVANSLTSSGSSATSSINSNNSTQTMSLQQSLMRLMGHHPPVIQSQSSVGNNSGSNTSSGTASSICSALTRRLSQTVSSAVSSSTNTTSSSGSPGIYRKASYTPGMSLIAAATGSTGVMSSAGHHLVHSHSLQSSVPSTASSGGGGPDSQAPSSSSYQSGSSRSGSWPSSEADSNASTVK